MDQDIIIKALETVSNTAAEKIIQALIDDDEEAAALELLREHGECIYVADDGNAEVEYPLCDSPQDAANEYVSDGDWGDDQSKSDWVTVDAWSRWSLGNVVLDDDDRSSYDIEIKPQEPECPDGDHDWCSPYEVVGGIKENPGVWGHGGGVIIHEVCRHCGCLKTTDTWAQRHDNGKQGLTSVEYDDGDHEFRDSWQEWHSSSLLDNAYELLCAEGYSPRQEDNGIYLAVSTGEEEDGEYPDSDHTLEEIKELLGEKFDVEFTGNGNTDKDGDSTFDINITLS